MAGRTTFVIAHRLSTIALADEIVVLEDGRDRRARHARRAAGELRALPRDRREGPARPGVPQPQARWSARWRGCERAGADELAPPAARHPGPRRASCAACSSCCGRTAAAWSADVRRAHGRDRRRRSRRRRWPSSRSTTASRPGDVAALTTDRGRVPGLRARLLGRDLRADLPRRLGRPARAAGPARADLRAPAAPVDRLLLAQPGGRADLAADQRRAGARPARHRRRGDALPVLADADRHGGDPAAARRRSSR